MLKAWPLQPYQAEDFNFCACLSQPLPQLGVADLLAKCDLGLEGAGEGGSRDLEREQASAMTMSACTGRYFKSLCYNTSSCWQGANFRVV